jgi:single-strand DNA-binding protein
MLQMNRVVIAGYISKAAEVRHLPSGTLVANVRVGESVRYAVGSGETREHTNWHSLSFYGKLADVAQALKKGDNVYVDGRIEQRQFIARDGSKPRTVHEIVVSQCHVIAPYRRGIKAPESAAGKNAANESLSTAAGIENDWPVAG